MTVKITTPEVNARAELRSLRSRVAALEALPRTPPWLTYENIVTNGSFDIDATGWLKLASAQTSVVSGALRATNGAANYGKVYWAAPTITGRMYSWSFDFIAGTSTAKQYRAGTATNASDLVALLSASVGTNTETFTALSTTSYLLLLNDNVNGSYNDWDNVSLWEADPSDDAPWLRLPHGQRVGNTGMVLRDGKVLLRDDFEEITDGSVYFVKPATAPGASTVFNIQPEFWA